MNQNKNLFNIIIKNGGLFLVLMVFIFFIVFRDIDIKSVAATISKVNVSYLFLAIVCMIVFILCEAMNTKRNLKGLGYETTLFKCFNYSVNGFFFSSITPSASGGQPMQVYRMFKDDIKVSHSTLVLFIELVFFQIVTILFSLTGFIANYSLLASSIGSIKYLLIIGLVCNVFMVVALLMTIFSKIIVYKILNVFIDFLKFLRFAKTEMISEKLYSVINDYKKCGSYIIKNKVIVFKTFATTCIQIFALHSIPYWVYCSFGLSDYSIFIFIGVQSVLFISVSALPLPGAVGVSESGFLMLFKLLFPITILNEAMLISRGISFYLILLLYEVFLLVVWRINYKRCNKKALNYSI